MKFGGRVRFGWASRRCGIALLWLAAVLGGCGNGHRAAVNPSAVPHVPATALGPPSPQLNCAHRPSSCGYPDQTNTGVPATRTLRPVSPSLLPAGASWNATQQTLTIVGDGVTVAGLDVHGTIQIYGNDDRVLDSRVTASGHSGEAVTVHDPATGTLIEDSTIQGTRASPVMTGVLGNQVTVVRDFVHLAVEDVNGGADSILDSYLISDGRLSGGHNEPILAADGTALPETIEHNTLLDPLGQTAAIIAGGPWGPLRNVTIDGNLMAGGDYVTECCQIPGQPSPANTRIVNNRYSRIYFLRGGSYGATSGLDPAVTTFTGNVWDETLRPVSPGT